MQFSASMGGVVSSPERVISDLQQKDRLQSIPPEGTVKKITNETSNIAVTDHDQRKSPWDQQKKQGKNPTAPKVKQPLLRSSEAGELALSLQPTLTSKSLASLHYKFDAELVIDLLFN